MIQTTVRQQNIKTKPPIIHRKWPTFSTNTLFGCRENVGRRRNQILQNFRYFINSHLKKQIPPLNLPPGELFPQLSLNLKFKTEQKENPFRNYNIKKNSTISFSFSSRIPNQNQTPNSQPATPRSEKSTNPKSPRGLGRSRGGGPVERGRRRNRQTIGDSTPQRLWRLPQRRRSKSRHRPQLQPRTAGTPRGAEAGRHRPNLSKTQNSRQPRLPSLSFPPSSLFFLSFGFCIHTSHNQQFRLRSFKMQREIIECIWCFEVQKLYKFGSAVSISCQSKAFYFLRFNQLACARIRSFYSEIFPFRHLSFLFLPFSNIWKVNRIFNYQRQYYFFRQNLLSVYFSKLYDFIIKFF